MGKAEEHIARINEARRVHGQQVDAIMDELKQSGWTLEQLLTERSLIDSMVWSFTADELRALADLKTWPQSKLL